MLEQPQNLHSLEHAVSIPLLWENMDISPLALVPPSELKAQLTFSGQRQRSLSKLYDSSGRVEKESDQVILQDEV